MEKCVDKVPPLSDHDDSNSSSEVSDNENYKTPKSIKRAAKKRVDKVKRKEQQKEKKRTEEKISKDDFYNKNLEFRTWLIEERKKLFDGLSAEKAKELFKRFVKKWNSRKLQKKYYRGIDLYLTSAPGRTENRWSFAEPTYDNEDLHATTNTDTAECDSSLDSPDDSSSPSTPFSTFGKNTPNSAIATRKILKPIFVPSPVVPKREDSVTAHMPDPVNSVRGDITSQLNEKDAQQTGAISKECKPTSGVQLRKRRYNQMSTTSFQRVTNSVHANQEVEKKKMKALLEMSRSTKVARDSWKEAEDPSTENTGCGYFRV